jgi:hypothetical protein
MAEKLITRIKTDVGNLRIDYNALANKPDNLELDSTLTKSGKAADAKIVGDKLKEIQTDVGNVSLSGLGVTASVAELNYVDGVTSNVQTQLDAKQPKIKGAASTIVDAMITPDSVLISDSSGYVGVSSISATELGYLSGVKSNIQNQLDLVGRNSMTVLWENLNIDEAFKAQDVSVSGICDSATYPYIIITTTTANVSDENRARGSILIKNDVGYGKITTNTVDTTDNGFRLDLYYRGFNLYSGKITFEECSQATLTIADKGITIASSSVGNASLVPEAVIGISGI